MYQKCGTKARTRFLDITKRSNTLGRSVCNALIGMHAFTGCDTISAFVGRGKMTALKQIKSDKAYQQAFTELGRSWEVSEELSEKLQEITCRMYLPSTRTTHVNKLRYRSSVQSVQKWTQFTFLLMRTVCPCTYSVQTTRLPSGGDVLSLHHLAQALPTVVGQLMKMGIW